MAINISHWLKVHSRWFKNYISVKKVYFNQLLDFPILLLLFLHSYFTLWMLDLFQYHQGVKQCGSRSGLTFCRAWSGFKLFAKVISRWQKLPLAGKELNAEQLLDTYYFLAKPWLMSISFESNFFHLAKVLATTNF